MAEPNARDRVMAKAMELAEALAASDEFKSKDEEKASALITLCNSVISGVIEYDYSSIDTGKQGCCG